MSDYGFREYQTLRTRILAANDHPNIATMAARVTGFVQRDDSNPVYSETLVNMLMAQGYEVLSHLDGQSPTHDLMVTRLVTRNIRTTVSVWQRTMDAMENRAEG